MWSKEVKSCLCRHIPQIVLMDSFGASEGLGFGLAVTTAEGGTNTAKFGIGEFCDVFDETDQKVEPGSGVRSEEHTSELQSLMRISYAVFCLKKKNKYKTQNK